VLERRKCTGIHRDDEIIEVGHDVVDRAERAADLLGERASLQAAQAVAFDRLLGSGNQSVSQPLPAFIRFRHGCQRKSVKIPNAT
jgi:hypothetical protein